MSTPIIEFATTAAGDIRCCGGSVRRKAFYLDEGSEPIFAWLHVHADHESLDHGVIICPPIGYEQVHSHRSLRQLADLLASKTIPTLRFDWHGTGDSPAVDEDPHRYRTWLNNVKQAVRWMRDTLGCRTVSLVGLRMGATFASLATRDNDIDSLVLWSPVIKGRSYIREMKALGLTSAASSRRSEVPQNDLEAAGFVISSETVADLSLVDLTKLNPQCRRVLVASRGDIAEDERLCNQWAAWGVPVRQIIVPGYAEMMIEPHRNLVPYQAIDEIVDWMTTECEPNAQQSTIHEDRIPLETSVSMPYSILPSDLQAPLRQIRESTLKIDGPPDLFGVISQPDAVVDPALPVIVVVNAGSAHHVGPNRLYVSIARRLAAEGFASVRIDLSELGDSASDTQASSCDPYPATAFRDVVNTLKQVQQEFGARKIVLMGLCSGAYTAFQSAAMIDNPALVESVLINPLTYYWKEGMTLDDSPTKHLRFFHYYKSVSTNPRKWLKLLTGQSKIGVKGALTLLARRLKIISRATSNPACQCHRARQADHLSHPQEEDLAGDLQRIVAFDRRLAMFFSSSDPGFGILNFHARWTANKLRATGRLAIEFIDDADHTFTMRAARADLMNALVRHLHRQYPGHGPTKPRESKLSIQ